MKMQAVKVSCSGEAASVGLVQLRCNQYRCATAEMLQVKAGDNRDATNEGVLQLRCCKLRRATFEMQPV